MVAVIIAIASLLGLSIFAFTDAGEHIAAPIEAVGKGVKEASFGLVGLVITGIVLWFLWQQSQ